MGRPNLVESAILEMDRSAYPRIRGSATISFGQDAWSGPALPPPRIHKIERRQFRKPVGLKAQAIQGREVARAESLLDLRA